MRQVDRKYTFWLAGYYDDFMSAVALADDKNTPGLKWYSSNTHHGNPFTGLAPLNPRYTYAWCERGDGASGRFNGVFTTPHFLSVEYPKTFNTGIGAWASLDENRDDTRKWNGLAQLSYPDSLMNANRQRYDTGVGLLGQAYENNVTKDNYAPKEGYMLFCNGYNSEGKYYAGTGFNDSSFGRAYMGVVGSVAFGSSSGELYAKSGLPTDSTTDTNASDSANVLTAPTFMIRTHLASLYMGEVTDGGDTADRPHEWLKEIKSPSGKPFLIQEVFGNTSIPYRPTLVYEGSLNSKGDLDIFTIRICPMAIDSTNARVKLQIGCEGNAWTSAAHTDSTYTHCAVEYEITPSAYPTAASTETDWSNLTAYDMWDDYDFIFNYRVGVYDIIKNGVTVSTGNTIGNKADGTQFTAADMYGWSMSVKANGAKVSVLIDRVGLIRPLNDHPSPLLSDNMPPALDFSYSAAVNTISQVNLTLVDDDSQLKLMPLFNGNAYSDWSLLMFARNVDRPIWRGPVKSMSYHNDAMSRTPKIKLSAADSFSEMDNQMPVWEFGQNAEGDTTKQVSYDRGEAQTELNMYNFGTTSLTSANQGLGFNEVEDGAQVFKNHLDSRMRNRSAHPIQMYLGEDDIGPNDPHSDWDDAITAGHATSDAANRVVHSRWIKDISKSLWFKFLFSRINEYPHRVTEVGGTKTNRCELAADFDVGDTTMSLNMYFPKFTTEGEGVIEFEDSDGFVDAGVYSGVTSSTTISGGCIVKTHQCRIMDARAKNASYYGTPAFPIPRHGINTKAVTFYQMQLYVPKSDVTNYNELLATTLTGEGHVGLEGASLPNYIKNSDWSLMNNRYIGATQTSNGFEDTINGIDY